MVRVAVAGGTGNVATQILFSSIESGAHDITIFTRSTPPANPNPKVQYKTVDYHDVTALTSALHGFDACLSFLIPTHDPDNSIQKNLVDACIAAKVGRFCPTEWGIRNGSGVPEYGPKDQMANYLCELNRNGKKIEYMLFQPSIFMDYFAHPYPLCKGLHTWPFFIDFEKRRAIILDGAEDEPIVLTCVHDDGEILKRALSDTREWPTVGGVRGCVTSINQLLSLGQKIRGGEWRIEHVSTTDIQNGKLNTEWVPQMTHPNIPEENRLEFSKKFTIMFLEALRRGSWMVGDEFNKMFPDYKFLGLEEYLNKTWQGKP